MARFSMDLAFQPAAIRPGRHCLLLIILRICCIGQPNHIFGPSCLGKKRANTKRARLLPKVWLGFGIDGIYFMVVPTPLSVWRWPSEGALTVDYRLDSQHRAGQLRGEPRRLLLSALPDGVFIYDLPFCDGGADVRGSRSNSVCTWWPSLMRYTTRTCRCCE